MGSVCVALSSMHVCVHVCVHVRVFVDVCACGLGASVCGARFSGDEKTDEHTDPG